MKSFDLNQFPSQIEQKLFTEAEGIQKIAEFISCNYPVFGLHIYDEDFRSEVIVRFLEKGTSLFRNYKPDLGDFFTYLYSYLLNIVSTIKKQNAKEKLQENITEAELKPECAGYHYNLSKFEKEYNPVSESKVPYVPADLTKEDFKKGFYFSEDSKLEKTILALTLKSSFYLDDEMTAKIAKVIGVEFDFLSKVLEFYNRDLERKIEKRRKIEGYRNKAYYCHKKYEKQIELLKKEKKQELNTTQHYMYESQIKKLEHINKIQKSNWEKLNARFKEGFMPIKPSNADIANLFGICERQISYYLNCAKNGKTDFCEISKRLEEIDKD